MNDMLNTKELAKVFKVHPLTITRWREKGLPFYKIGSSIRFDVEEVKQWVRGQEDNK